MGVVGSELRPKHVQRVEQTPGAHEVGNVSVGLHCEDRKVVVPCLLRSFDLGIPVRALHQSHVEPPSRRLRKSRQPVQAGMSPLSVGLHGHAKALPAGERRRAGDRLQ